LDGLVHGHGLLSLRDALTCGEVGVLAGDDDFTGEDGVDVLPCVSDGGNERLGVAYKSGVAEVSEFGASGWKVEADWGMKK
jgi:hypothetical protein